MKRFLKAISPNFMIENHEKKKIEGLNKGSKVLCPICKCQFNVFAPYGLNKRKNAECHYCHSLERHRLLWLYLNEHIKFFKSKHKIRILHFAPEKIFFDAFIKKNNIEYFPCDLLPETYNFDGRIRVTKADITNIPFEDNYFDFILCNHVLEHIPDDNLAMSELFRVMKKGGWGIFQVPIDYNRDTTYEDFNITSPKEREKAFGQHDHVRWYGRDYKDKLEQAGFTVKADDFVRQFTTEYIFRFGLSPHELIYHCSK